MIYLLLMIEIFNDVVVVLIGIFGENINYRGDSAQNFIFVIENDCDYCYCILVNYCLLVFVDLL